jgi:hypothetical protein
VWAVLGITQAPLDPWGVGLSHRDVKGVAPEALSQAPETCGNDRSLTIFLPFLNCSFSLSKHLRVSYLTGILGI